MMRRKRDLRSGRADPALLAIASPSKVSKHLTARAFTRPCSACLETSCAVSSPDRKATVRNDALDESAAAIMEEQKLSGVTLPRSRVIQPLSLAMALRLNRSSERSAWTCLGSDFFTRPHITPSW